MTRKEALETLLAKVEYGKWDTRIDEPCAETLLQHWALTIDRIIVDNDMNAAMSLHNAVLPGWAWRVGTLATEGVQVWIDKAYGLRRLGYIGTTKSPAKSWLIAILCALIAECDT